MHRDGRTDTVYPDFVRGLWVDQYSRSIRSHPLPIDRRRWKWWPLLEHDAYTYVYSRWNTYVWNEIFTSQRLDIDGQPVWKYITPRDVIYNFITESIYRCSIEGVVDRSIWTVECRLFRIELFLEKRPPIGQRKRLVWKWRIEWSDIAIETEISKIWRYELKGCARYLNGFELNGNNWIANSEGNYNARIIRIGDTSNISEIL